MHFNDLHEKIPSASECVDILKRALPDDGKIVEHCMQVATLALHFAKAVGMSEADVGLVTAGALLHDISRKEKGHAKVGATAINQMGYPAVAEIVKAHVDINLNTYTEIDAAQIVYLADKLVKRTGIVSLDVRFYDKIHGQDKVVAEAAEKRLANARKIQQRLESKTGKTLEEIMSGFNEKEYYDLFAQTR
jgi:putative nucleotidyltransferase with HDIG domain